MYEEKFMREAIAMAREAADLGEVPVGAVIVKDGVVIARGVNRRETDKNALSHAETSAIGDACRALRGWRLAGCDIYVTMEPCPMCAGAIVNARMENVYFGCKNPESGFAGSRFNLFGLEGMYQPHYSGGCLESECARPVKDFFSGLRKKNNKEDLPVTVSVIAAKGTNNEIGADNSLLWHISADLKFFKGVTMGKAVIMGRKTFESLPKVLPGRKNIVITRSPDYQAPGATVVHSAEEALREADTPEVFIIGGESVYREFLPKADRLYITEVDFFSGKADAFFPEFDKNDYLSETLGSGTENGLSFRHILYTRRNEK